MSEYKVKVTWLIWIAALVRCAVASLVELGNDEVYYYTYAVQPDWNHFDHPPLVGSVIRFFTLHLYGANTFTMRLGAIVCAMISTALIFGIGRMIRNERTGFVAAVLYTASIYTSVISGIFILPDSPATVFWLASIYCMLRVTGVGELSQRDRSASLLWLGLWIGLATMSKVHGVFLWFGFGAYILFHQRSLLRNAYLYLAILLTALVMSPILFWNIRHDFITWRFHGERVTPAAAIDLKSFFTALIGQFLYANPLVAILCTAGVAAFCRQAGGVTRSVGILLIWIGIPIIMATTLVSLFRPVLPHWSGLGLIPLMLLTAAAADLRLDHERPWKFYRGILNSLLRFVLIILILGVLLIRFYPGTLGSQDEQKLGRGDFTLDMSGWRQLPGLFDEVRQQDILNGKMDADAALIVHKWFPGGHLYFYLARPLGMRTVGYGTLNDLHKFAWLNAREGYVDPGQDAWFVVPSNNFVDAEKLFVSDFESVELAARIPQMRGGKESRYWYIYRLIDARSRLGYILDHAAAPHP